MCRNEGVKRFAHLARAGFVAAKLMKSAVTKYLKSNGLKNLWSIDGLGKEFPSGLRMLKRKKDAGRIEEYFGHLRPGTYDINNKSTKKDMDPTMGTSYWRMKYIIIPCSN